MKSEANDIYEMLDTLALPVAAQRFAQLSEFIHWLCTLFIYSPSVSIL